MTRRKALIIWVVSLVLIIFLVSWASVLSSTDAISNPLASLFPWPIACTTRGCVSSRSWVELYKIQSTFATEMKEEPATSVQTLTTLIRQHLTRSATLRSPVTLSEAEKYRREILHLTDEGQIKKLTGLTPQQYDQQVILPFLKQEALRQQMKVESLDELYVQLSKNRWIFVLPPNLWWDYEKGIVGSG